MSTDVAAVDPRALDGFTSVDDQVCPYQLSVVVAGQTLWLACEVDGEHDDHEATVRWKAEPEPAEDDDG